MSPKLYIETVGCQMNVLDSELVVGGLRRQGFELTHDPREADVILFNTCSVREHAEEKVYSALGRLRGHKQAHPEKVLGVLGCMAQKDQKKILRRAPYVDIICGTGQLAKMPQLIAAVQNGEGVQLALSLARSEASRHEVEASFESYDPTRDPSMRPTPFQAYVRVQIGCDKFFTNCPKDMSDDLLDAVRSLSKVSPYLHVPAQSGDNDMLRRMKRLYTVEFYRDMLARCRERVPGVAVSSDFIVGFCGETEEQ